MRIVHIVIAHNSDGRVGWEGQRDSSSVDVSVSRCFLIYIVWLHQQKVLDIKRSCELESYSMREGLDFL